MGSLQVATSNSLDSLPPRPPTPPRETRHEPTASARIVLASADRQLNLHTPPSIYSPAESAVTTSGAGSRKKVGFSARAEYKDPPVYTEGQGVVKTHQPTPVSLPSSTSKPVKSILKVTTYSPNPLDPSSNRGSNPNDPNEDIPTMLESAIQHLAGPNRDSKVDAYMVLTQALKTTNNLPDRAAMQEQIGFFTQCIQRDIAARSSEGALDSSLVNHALNLLATVIYFPSIAAAIPHEFAVFIIDHCIRTFEDSASPKEFVRHLMQVVGHQRFPAKVMTADRVARLISSLHNIEEHLKGKSIIMARVLIYRQLLRNCRGHMVANPDWLLDLFTDMLSSLKDIRSAAIQLGLEAGFSAGKDKQLTRKVAEIFSLTLEDKTYLKYYEERLELMVKDKNISASVPRIWTAVILLLRMPMDKWEASKNWLRIIQSCFNSSDVQTKTEANYAWGRLIYIAHFEERTFAKNVITLRQPLETQLRRKPTNKREEEIRRTVLGGICNLLYYEFKPTANLTLLDAYWDNGVEPLLMKLLDPKPEDAQERLAEASKILSGLFDSTTKRVWKEERVTENVLVRPDELPPIDPKWLRRNAGRVFALVSPILQQTFHTLADKKSITSRLWEALVGSVASAASKEIKVSPDTATFVAHAFTVLHEVWQRGLPADENSLDNSSVFLASMRDYIEVMVKSLGLLPFTEKMLSVDKENCFVSVTTPSSRFSKHQGPPKSSFHHLFSILSTLPTGVLDNNDFSQFMEAIFSPFFPGRDEQADKNLAQELLSSIPMNALGPYGPWQLAAERLSKWLEPNLTTPQSGSSSSQPLAGHDYREAVRVLERGLRSTPNLPWDLWQGLFSRLSERAQVETGDAGLALVVVEPLAKVALEQFITRGSAKVSLNTVKCVAEMISVATHPRDQQAVDAARRRLWGTPSVGPKSASFDPFDNVYKVVDTALEYLYNEFDVSTTEVTISLLAEVGKFLTRCNVELVAKAITALQDGIALWVQDGRRHMGGLSNTNLSPVKHLWAMVSQAMTRIQHPEQQLGSLERLFCAAFMSSHRHIINNAASLWNTLFKDVEEIQYPDKLQSILISLQPHIELALPGLSIPATEPLEQPQSFVESQEETSFQKTLSTRSSRRNTPRSSRRPNSPAPRTRAVPAKRPIEHTASSKGSKKKRRSTTPKLRHDDSQIEFAPIHSSPTTDHEVESQLLTEHQKEVRERQKQNEALFPTLASSPKVTAKDVCLVHGSLPAPGPRSPELPQAATPEHEARFDDYVASTPTPRRGQLVSMPELGIDPPSSPPEPRGNPLADEIRSRSASNSIRDEWQDFSSSPISGSPNPARQIGQLTPSRPARTMAIVLVPGVGEDAEDAEDAMNAISLSEDDLPALGSEEEVVEDSVLSDPPQECEVSQVPGLVLAEETPLTPKQQQQPLEPEETPKSGDEVFMDALTSPQPATPGKRVRVSRAAAKKAAQRLTYASSVTKHDGENSQAKVVVELGSRNVDPRDYQLAAASTNDKSVQDAIVVRGSPNTRRQSLRRAKSSPIPQTIPSSQLEDSELPATQSRGRAGRGKRKRGSSKAAESRTNGSKKRRHQEAATQPDEWPDSHVASATRDALEGDKPVEPEHASSVAQASVQIGREESPDLSVGPMGLSVDPVVPVVTTEAGNEVQAEIVVQSPIEAIDEVTEHGSTAELVASSGETGEKVSIAKPVESRAVDQGESDAVEVIKKQELALVVEHDIGEDAGAEPASEVGIAQGQDVVMEEARMDKAQEIRSQLLSAMEAMRAATLSREEVYKIEDMMMDFKRELYEAEKRGRV